MSPLHFFETAGSIWLITEWAIRIWALFVVPRNRKPSSGTAWLMLIFFFPIFGILLFAVLGSPKLPKARRDAQKNLDKVVNKTLTRLKRKRANKALLDAPVPLEYEPIARLTESLGHLPVFGGNAIEVLPEYNEVIEQIARDIDTAQYFVHLEYFIIAEDEITEQIFAAMARAVRRGVTVRVLYDSLSTKRYKGWRNMLKRMQNDGVLAQPMLQLRLPGRGYVRPDLRNHRKLCIVDGQIAYTGSLNLIRRDYHRKDDIHYDELVVRMQGPIALQCTAVFMNDWYVETGEVLSVGNTPALNSNIENKGNSLAQILPSGPGYDDENNLKLFTSLIHASKRQVVIVNPYFVPDDALTTAITSAARRGVEVIMINSEAMDQWMVGHAQRSFYQVLLEAGVKIYLYKAPVLLHSKFMTVDSRIATVGSSNFDIRSFSLNLEVTLVSYDPEVTAALNAVEKIYLSRSKQIKLSEWKQRSRRHHLLDNIARLTAALQ